MGVNEAILLLLVIGVIAGAVYFGTRRRTPVGAAEAPVPSPGVTSAHEQAPASGAPVGPPTNGLAVLSILVAVLGGIVGLVLTPIVLPIAAILALVFGYRALKEIDLSGGRQGGRGLALAAVVLGWVGVVGGIIAVVLVYFLLQEAEHDEPFGFGLRLLAAFLPHG